MQQNEMTRALAQHAKSERSRHRWWGLSIIGGICPAVAGAVIVWVAARETETPASAGAPEDRIALGLLLAVVGVAVFVGCLKMMRRLDRKASAS